MRDEKDRRERREIERGEIAKEVRMEILEI